MRFSVSDTIVSYTVGNHLVISQVVAIIPMLWSDTKLWAYQLETLYSISTSHTGSSSWNCQIADEYGMYLEEWAKTKTINELTELRFKGLPAYIYKEAIQWAKDQ